MRLILATPDGEVIPVIDDIDEYDLSKPFARAEVMNSIQDALKKAEDK